MTQHRARWKRRTARRHVPWRRQTAPAVRPAQSSRRSRPPCPLQKFGARWHVEHHAGRSQTSWLERSSMWLAKGLAANAVRRPAGQPTFGNHIGLADGQEGQDCRRVGPQQPDQGAKVVGEAQACRYWLAWCGGGSSGGPAGAQAAGAAAEQRLRGCRIKGPCCPDLHGWRGPCSSNQAAGHCKFGSRGPRLVRSS